MERFCCTQTTLISAACFPFFSGSRFPLNLWQDSELDKNIAVTKCTDIWVVTPHHPARPLLSLVNYTLLWCTNNSTRARWLPTNTHGGYIRSTRVNRLNTHPSSLTMWCKNTHTCTHLHTHTQLDGLSSGGIPVSDDEVRPLGASHNPD